MEINMTYAVGHVGTPFQSGPARGEYDDTFSEPWSQSCIVSAQLLRMTQQDT